MGSGSDSSSSNEDSDSDYLAKVVRHESDSLATPKNDGVTTRIKHVQNEITQQNNNIDDKDVDTDGSSSNKRKRKWDDVDFSMFIEDTSLSGILM